MGSVYSNQVLLHVIEADFVGLKCLQALCAEGNSQWSRVSLLGCMSSWPCGEIVGSFPWPSPPLALVCDSPWSIESVRLVSAFLELLNTPRLCLNSRLSPVTVR